MKLCLRMFIENGNYGSEIMSVRNSITLYSGGVLWKISTMLYDPHLLQVILCLTGGAR